MQVQLFLPRWLTHFQRSSFHPVQHRVSLAVTLLEDRALPAGGLLPGLEFFIQGSSFPGSSDNPPSYEQIITGIPTPNLEVYPAVGEQGEAIPLDIVATASTGILKIQILNVPSHVLLSAGDRQADGSWFLRPHQLSDLTLRSFFPGTFTLTVKAIAEDPISGDSNETTEPLDVQIHVDNDYVTLLFPTHPPAASTGTWTSDGLRLDRNFQSVHTSE